eukprot:3509875-Prymnesium_polylepis.1
MKGEGASKGVTSDVQLCAASRPSAPPPSAPPSLAACSIDRAESRGGRFAGTTEAWRSWSTRCSRAKRGSRKRFFASTSSATGAQSSSRV